jgi:CheY-like chemotaxis protein
MRVRTKDYQDDKGLRAHPKSVYLGSTQGLITDNYPTMPMDNRRVAVVLHDIAHLLLGISHEAAALVDSAGDKRERRLGARIRGDAERGLEKIRDLLRGSGPKLPITKTPTPNNEPLKILWVDDDALHAVQLSSRFRDAGFAVTFATTVDEAVASFARIAPDAVVLDLLMPPGSFSLQETAGGTRTGLALARKLRGTQSTLPILFTSVAVPEDVIAWCAENPPAVFRAKPELISTTLEELRRLVQFGSDLAIETLLRRLGRAPALARALLYRHDDRPTIVIQDEYDFQDLVRALLRMYYEDLREEEWTPSRAGASSRIDFLLHEDNIALELKMMRKGMRDRVVGEQILIDIGRYAAHPSVRRLVCVIADPHKQLKNPVGLARDLERLSRPNLVVKVLVVEI